MTTSPTNLTSPTSLNSLTALTRNPVQGPTKDRTQGPDLAPAVVWSIAGNDSGGGAGLAADLRAAQAFGVHLCPVVSAITAQNSEAVLSVVPMDAEWLDAQLQALAQDLPPRAIKTGLLGGVAQIKVVARWVDRLREKGPLALVVDPVLGSTSGTSFANQAVVQAYREWLLPRATLLTPNRREAMRLLGEDQPPKPLDEPQSPQSPQEPQWARRLMAQGVQAVCITGGDTDLAPGQSLDWLSTPEASGWLSLPREATVHHHGTGCTFATSAASALALGFVCADAVVLAKMATTHALRHAYPAGAGAGPVQAQSGFGNDPSLLPTLSWGAAEVTWQLPDEEPPLKQNQKQNQNHNQKALGLYAVVDHLAWLKQVLDAGIRTVQLRIKAPLEPEAAWWHELNQNIAQAVALAKEHGALLFINDHWRQALAQGAPAVHLGQEDLAAMTPEERQDLSASGLDLGISTHSLWELCRARALLPRYIACGPVWPTLTKAMPWLPQGLHNLAWWQQMAGCPVVAIGGILSAEQVEQAAACGVDGVAVVRAVQHDPAQGVPLLQAALEKGWALAKHHETQRQIFKPSLPKPSLA